jgi:hypothetical protein
MNKMFHYVRKKLESIGVAVTRPETLRALGQDRLALHRTQHFHQFLGNLNTEAMTAALDLFPHSHGENFQDIFAMLVLGQVKGGFFVEFGATDGVTGSNSYILESVFGWEGCLAEPARVWQDQLRGNRKALISSRCVWHQSGLRLSFREAGGLSTIDAYTTRDRHAEMRRSGCVYDVETISLNDLLESSKAPPCISYMSIDTEGSEYDILSSMDFDRWHVSVLTVEHNYRPEREQILSLMTRHDYVRAPVSISKYDDWYVAKELADRMYPLFRDSKKKDSA